MERGVLVLDFLGPVFCNDKPASPLWRYAAIHRRSVRDGTPNVFKICLAEYPPSVYKTATLVRVSMAALTPSPSKSLVKSGHKYCQ